MIFLENVSFDDLFLFVPLPPPPSPTPFAPPSFPPALSPFPSSQAFSVHSQGNVLDNSTKVFKWRQSAWQISVWFRHIWVFPIFSKKRHFDYFSSFVCDFDYRDLFDRCRIHRKSLSVWVLVFVDHRPIFTITQHIKLNDNTNNIEKHDSRFFYNLLSNLQHACSCGQSAIVCKSCGTHGRLSHVCHVPCDVRGWLRLACEW